MKLGNPNGIRWLPVLLSLLLPGMAAGSTIVGIVDWDTLSPSTNWTVREGAADLTVQGPEDRRWLEISMPAGATNAWVAGRAADLFVGTWDASSWIEFDFWASNAIPETLELRWGAEGDTTWRIGVTPYTGAGAWQTLQTPMLGETDMFQNPGLDEDDFLADLAAIDWIGLYLYQDGASDQVYGLDNVKLMVPEPAELALAAAALSVVLLTLHRKRFLPAPLR